jgi:hypothetical protein
MFDYKKSSFDNIDWNLDLHGIIIILTLAFVALYYI